MSAYHVEKAKISVAKVEGILRLPRVRLLLFTENNLLFAPDIEEDFFDSPYDVEISSDVRSFDEAAAGRDIVLLCGHLKSEETLAWRLQAAPGRPFVALWAWDNHHEPLLNIRAAMVADAVFPAHWFAHDTLANAATLVAPHLPLCVTQWSRRFLASMEERILGAERSDKLYGGFFNHTDARGRNDLITSYGLANPDSHVFILGLDKQEVYFSHTAERRLMDWASHKVSLNLPLRDDVSQRLFDALACGLVPVVPQEFPDLDRVVARSDQDRLPIVRMSSPSAEGIAEAHARALRLFDQGGREGVLRRHRFARDHHALRNRIDRFVGFFRAGTALSGARVEFNDGIRFYLK